jgi:hypothetical protein
MWHASVRRLKICRDAGQRHGGFDEYIAIHALHLLLIPHNYNFPSPAFTVLIHTPLYHTLYPLLSKQSIYYPQDEVHSVHLRRLPGRFR